MRARGGGKLEASPSLLDSFDDLPTDDLFYGPTPPTKRKLDAPGSVSPLFANSDKDSKTKHKFVRPTTPMMVRNQLAQARPTDVSAADCPQPDEKALAAFYTAGKANAKAIDALYALLPRAAELQEGFTKNAERLHAEYGKLAAALAKAAAAEPHADVQREGMRRVADERVKAGPMSPPVALAAWSGCDQPEPWRLQLACLTHPAFSNEAQQRLVTQLYPLHALKERALQQLVRAHNETLAHLNRLPGLSAARRLHMPNLKPLEDIEPRPLCLLRDQVAVLWYALSDGVNRRYEAAREKLKGAIAASKRPALRKEWQERLDGATPARWLYAEQQAWQEFIEANTNFVRVYVSIRWLVPEQGDAKGPPPVRFSSNGANVVVAMSEQLCSVVNLGGSSCKTLMEFGPFMPRDSFKKDIAAELTRNNRSHGTSVLLITYGYSGTGKTYNVREFLANEASANRVYFYQDQKYEVRPGSRLPEERAALFVRPTPNNPESSRAFKFIELQDDSQVTVLDMAGHEDPMWFITLMMPTLDYDLWRSRADTSPDAFSIVDSDRLYMMFSWIHDCIYRKAQRRGGPPPYAIDGRQPAYLPGPDAEAIEAGNKPAKANPNEDWSLHYSAGNVKYSMSKDKVQQLLLRLMEREPGGKDKPFLRVHGIGAFTCYIILESLLKGGAAYDYAKQFGGSKEDEEDDKTWPYIYSRNGVGLEGRVGTALADLGVLVRTYLSYMFSRYSIIRACAHMEDRSTGRKYAFTTDPPPTIHGVHMDWLILQKHRDVIFNGQGKIACMYMEARWGDADSVPLNVPPMDRAGAADAFKKRRPDFRPPTPTKGRPGTAGRQRGGAPPRKAAAGRSLLDDVPSAPRPGSAAPNKQRNASGMADAEKKKSPVWGAWLNRMNVEMVVDAVRDPSLVAEVKEELYYWYNNKSWASNADKRRRDDMVRMYAYYLKMVDLLTRSGRPAGANEPEGVDAIATMSYEQALELPIKEDKQRMKVLDAVRRYMLSCVKEDIVADGGKQAAVVRVYGPAEVARLVAEAEYIQRVNSNLQLYLQDRRLLADADADAVTRYIAGKGYTRILMLANIRNDRLLSQQVGAYNTLKYVSVIKSTS